MRLNASPKNAPALPPKSIDGSPNDWLPNPPALGVGVPPESGVWARAALEMSSAAKSAAGRKDMSAPGEGPQYGTQRLRREPAKRDVGHTYLSRTPPPFSS